MKILAHRGMPFKYPENTLISFEKSIEKGYGLEIDVQRSKDGKLVISHDLNVKRLTGVDKNIVDMDLNEIRLLDYGSHFNSKYSSQKIPTFQEVVDLLNNKEDYVVAVHVKDENQSDILELLSIEFEKNNLYQNWFIFDLTIEGANKLKGINPKIKIAVSVGEKKYSKTIYLLAEILDLDCFDIIWVDEWKSELYSKEFLDAIRKTGKKSYVISPELHIKHGHPLSKQGYEKCWEKLIEWEVDGICTDYPEKLNNLINKTIK